MYSLQKYAGSRSRYECPGCHRQRCFTRYVDERGEALDPSVGKCDHLSSCGYHLTPAAFFREHPERRPGPDWRYEKVDIEELRRQGAALRAKEPCVIPFEVVQLSMLRKRRSDLVLFLERVLDPMVVEGLVEAYRLGTTRGGDVIFWEIDVEGRCRTGKVMKYDRESGHRVKDEAVAGRVNWVHSMLKRADLTPPRWLLPSGWELRQCLFGEHLLREFPEKTVALVESEKTAVICAGLMPGHLWLATGGKQGINERLMVLQGRRVVAYPDIDGYDEWVRKLSEFPSLGVRVSPLLQQHASAEDVAAHIDIADWLLRYRALGGGPGDAGHPAAFLKVRDLVSPECHEELEKLIVELGLECYGV